jgi:hypothetical protein
LTRVERLFRFSNLSLLQRESRCELPTATDEASVVTNWACLSRWMICVEAASEAKRARALELGRTNAYVPTVPLSANR